MNYNSVILTTMLLSLFSAVILFTIENIKDNVNLIKYAPMEQCSKKNYFYISYNEKNGAVIRSPGGFNFFGNGWIEFIPCKNTLVRFSAKADTFDDTGAGLSIVSGDSTKHFSIKQKQHFSFHLKQQDKIMIGFTNDHYEANSRFATISFAKFQGEGCNFIRFVSSDDNEVSWIPEIQKMGISGRSVARIRPCSSGVLNFHIQGRSFDGNLPIVRLQSKKEILANINVMSINKYFSYKVDGSDIYVNILNPANQSIKDRNLFIEDISLITQ